MGVASARRVGWGSRVCRNLSHPVNLFRRPPVAPADHVSPGRRRALDSAQLRRDQLEHARAIRARHSLRGIRL
ncbi:hypothetical protein SEA_PAVLO_113 [Microbacterium phage Pavlo]|nr:hypothetical protein SEA_PAVLO_1 [Microbacterium phage Pavlo]UVG34169.1 hypothetical protein SEA_PAVLO_113 [Microbacterium phage Pavlo]